MAPMRLQYSEEAMTTAYTSDSKGTGFRETARLYAVLYPTLRARINGRKSMRKMERTVLGVELDTQLTDWIEECARRGFGRTKKQLLSTVQNCLNQEKETTPFKDNKPGEKWYRLFRQRHKEKLALCTPQDLGSQRAAVSEAKIRNWFAKAKEDILAADPSVLECPDRIFNCDESGFHLGGRVKRKDLAAKADKHVYQVSNDIGCEGGQTCLPGV
ncbi:tigger transposable element-derived protein 6-like protein [Plakobranchus ocellatus]|uniref:Tigger transposable element-derived protein 6-like protein n=1 Tax=Plakobranchus ocellatus TaxID=259542 RepID=A0AAV4BG47_9GAST|nr:tigger transposable element-derived protein 6-like protein [Plakobranchus ocellatus]